MILETVIISGLLVGFGGYVFRIKSKHDRIFETKLESWETDLLSFVNENGLKGIDLEFKPHSKKKLISTYNQNINNDIKFIASQIDKGYDFIDTTYSSGYYFGPHIHYLSNEFFYIISGKIKIKKCKFTKKNCNNCIYEKCVLFENKEHFETMETINIGPGEWAYIEKDIYHTFEVLEETHCIVITVPPISLLDYSEELN